jgi:hypothetical protein
LLLDKYGLITAEQLAAGLERQDREGGRLGQKLIEMGLITSADLEAALQDQ